MYLVTGFTFILGANDALLAFVHKPDLRNDEKVFFLLITMTMILMKRVGSSIMTDGVLGRPMHSALLRKPSCTKLQATVLISKKY